MILPYSIILTGNEKNTGKRIETRKFVKNSKREGRQRRKTHSILNFMGFCFSISEVIVA